jgi:glycosyltransferase involved in cell wall biosynthesis
MRVQESDRGIDAGHADVPAPAVAPRRPGPGPAVGREALEAPAGRTVRKPLASVIIPTLDEERCLGSLLAALSADLRERHSLEVVVSDGGSTDRTVEVARSGADRIIVHSGPERQTIAAGRNAGARAAGGGVLLFINADVRLPDDLDGFLAAVLLAAAEAGAATCRVAVHPDEATLIDRVVLGACDRLFLAMNKLGIGMGRGECHAVRKTVFLAVGGYDESLVAGEDFDLFKRIASWGRKNRAAHVRFLWHWTVWEDPRRYRQRGYARTMLDWFRNTVSVTLLGRSYSRVWEPVR